MEVKGSVIALASGQGVSETIDSIVFTVANAVGGEPINLSTSDRVIVIDYRDAEQISSITDWTLDWRVRNDTDDLLDTGELAEIAVPVDGLTSTLGVNTGFAIEIKPPSGAVLSIQRTTPAYLDLVNDLQ
jgi:flagellin FlaB